MRQDTLDNWTLLFRGSSYMAPEQRVPRLVGARSSDGKKVETSMVVTLDGPVAVTENGSRYTLGAASAPQAEWMAESDWPELTKPAGQAIPGDEIGRRGWDVWA